MAADLRASRFLRACRGEPVDRPPLWIMRQAGRYLPEYRATRERAGSFLALCRTPDLAVEVTLQPIRRFHFDAAILFSDILIPAEAMGAEIAFTEGEGPRIANPIRDASEIARLRDPDPREVCPYVFEAIRTLRRELEATPLISFAAAPFTLACYLIEGAGSRDFAKARAFLQSDEATAEALLDRIARYTARHLAAGVEAGASAVQLFESWGGVLSPGDFARWGAGAARRVVDLLRPAIGPDVPVIYYVQGSPRHIEAMRASGASVLGLDWRCDLDEVARAVGSGVALQGNLDPAVLLTGPEVVRARALDVLRRGLAARGGHIMNLGHGITPDAPIANVEALVETVRGFAGDLVA